MTHAIMSLTSFPIILWMELPWLLRLLQRRLTIFSSVPVNSVCSDGLDAASPRIVSGILLLTASAPEGNIMDTIRVVSINFAASVFQVCVWMADGAIVWNKKLTRQTLPEPVHRHIHRHESVWAL